MHSRLRDMLFRSLMAAAWLSLAWIACAPTPPARPPHRGPRHPPPKPGESITRTIMCSCTACEPASCCHELEQDRPEIESCAQGYDFSKCNTVVKSCDSRCFQHRWRTRVETGCAAKRPDRCCHDQPE